jgi:hypothetical protein
MRRPDCRRGDPLADISLLDGQGEYFTHIMKDGVFYKRQ